MRKKKRCKKYKSISYTRNYVKNKNREKSTEPNTNLLLFERLQRRRRESSQLLYTMALTIDASSPLNLMTAILFYRIN